MQNQTKQKNTKKKIRSVLYVYGVVEAYLVSVDFRYRACSSDDRKSVHTGAQFLKPSGAQRLDYICLHHLSYVMGIPGLSLAWGRLYKIHVFPL